MHSTRLKTMLSYVIAFIFVSPLIVILILSVTNLSKITLTPNQYISLLSNNLEFFYLYFKSFLITTIIAVGQIAIAIFVSYYYARSKSRLSKVLFVLYIFLMLLPPQIMLIPTTLLYYNLETLLSIKIFDNYLAVILPGVFSTFGVVYLKQYFSSFDDVYFDMAKVDGAGDMRILFSVLLPNSIYAILLLFCLLFLEYWNLIEPGLLYMNSNSKMPVSIYLNTLFARRDANVFASAVFYILPMVLFIKALYSGYSLKAKETGDVLKNNQFFSK